MHVLADASGSGVALQDIVVMLIPWVLVFLVIWIIFSRIGGKSAQAKLDRHIERYERHMDAVETKLDRLIQIVDTQKRND